MELDHVAALGEKNLVPVLLYLFHRVQRRLVEGRPTLVALGEAWLALSHSLFREKIREWLKTLRKSNGAAVLETQSISDITNSPIRDVIIESCLTKIFLPNTEARTEHDRMRELGTIQSAASLARQAGLHVHVGHGLTYANVQPIARVSEVEELNIGHSIVSRAVLIGMESAVREMKEAINAAG